MLAFLLRAAWVGRAWEIFVDEVTYARLAQNAQHTLHPRLYGAPFYLHPFGFFEIEGLFYRIVGFPADVVSAIYSARLLNALLSAVSALLIFFIVRRVSKPSIAVLCALAFSIDPFLIRIDSRNLIEAAAMLFVLAGHLAFLAGLDRARSHRSQSLMDVVVGVLFGCAILTKEITVLVTILPLLYVLAVEWPVSRRRALVILSIPLAMYAVYALTVIAAGDWSAYSSQDWHGVIRFAGASKETGFKRSGGPSFLNAIGDNWDQFLTTYVLIGLGVVATIALLRSRVTPLRWLGVWSAASLLFLGYSVGIGTLEEQFFYYLVVVDIIAVGVAAPLVLDGITRAYPLWSPRARTIWLTAVAVYFIFGGVVWVRVHARSDNGFDQLLGYMHQNVPQGSHVAVMLDVGDFLLNGYDIGPWNSTDLIAAHHAQYVLLGTRDVDEGYGRASREFAGWVQSHGHPVYVFHGPTHGGLTLYQLQ